MQVDDPPCLSVGTAVSAKYKGAFCEAKVSNAVHVVKCKVSFKMGLGTYTINDDNVRGTLRAGQLVQARHPEKRDYLEATIMKIQDCSQYTVVFDDGDITTLRRSALCLKSGRHFNESETLDQLPLTHPEHFGNPVVGGRRGRRNRQLKEDSSEDEPEEENELDLAGYTEVIGRVVSIETTDKKRNKDNWFPGLVVIPSAQPTVRINVKDEYLVRSFKDGRYYTVPKKEVTEFTREMGEKVESASLSEAVQKALKYLNNGDLPVHWERSTLFNQQSMDSDSEDNYSDSCDEEQSEEKDLFVAQLYKFMEDARTPLNTSPTIAKRDVDLHRLYRIVEKLGGYNRVTNQSKWKTVATRMKLPNNHNIWSQVQNVYKTYLSSFETFYRTLGVTMTVKTRSTKKNRGRSLIRDKDRATPVNSPRPDKEEDSSDKKDEEKPVQEERAKRKSEVKKDEEKRKKDIDNSDTNSTDTAEQSDAPSTSTDSGRPKRIDVKTNKDKKIKPTVMKVKAAIETPEEPVKKIEDKAQQHTRSKMQGAKVIVKDISKEANKDLLGIEKKKELKVATPEPQNKAPAKIIKKELIDEKKRSRKRPTVEEKAQTPETNVETTNSIPVNIGDRLIVYYGPNVESKITYEAKVIDIKDSSYLVHYTGWNTRYDEWIQPENIAVNLSIKNKQLKIVPTSSPSSKGTPPKVAGRRGRNTSTTSKNTGSEHPRSTTPSSVTSSSSRTKSPATPATRSSSRMTRQDSNRQARRSSAHTEISVHSDSESDASESEVETIIIRTRSGSKTEPESETSLFKKKTKPMPKTEKRKFEDAEEDPDKTKRKGRNRKSDEDDEEKSIEADNPKNNKPIKKLADEDPDKEETDQKVIESAKKSDDKDVEIVEDQDLSCIIIESETDSKEKMENTTSDLIIEIKSDDDSIEKEIEPDKVKCVKKSKKSPEKIVEDSDDNDDNDDNEDENTNLPKGRDFDLNQIRLELKGLKVPPIDSVEKDVTSSDESASVVLVEKSGTEDDEEEDEDIEEDEEVEVKNEEQDVIVNSEDIYEFKEPEPFEFESRKLVEEKNNKKRLPRLFEDTEKSPKKKTVISPSRTDDKESPNVDKKKLRKNLKKQSTDSDDEFLKAIDAFDKLVESPSYNMGKSVLGAELGPQQQQQLVQQKSAVEKILAEPLFAEQIDVYRTDRLDLTDNDNVLRFTRGDELFSDTFSADRNLELVFCKPEEPKNKESDEEDSLRESIQRVIAQTSISTDEDSGDALHITPPTLSYQAKKKVNDFSLSLHSIKSEESKPVVSEPEKIQISPALQETDSSLLESIVSQPPLLAVTSDTKDISLKQGPRIADTLLQKLSLLKNKASSPSPKHSDDESIELPKIKFETKFEPDETKIKMLPKLNESKKCLFGEEKSIVDSKLSIKPLKKPCTLNKIGSPNKSPRPLSPVAAPSTIKKQTSISEGSSPVKVQTPTAPLKSLKTLGCNNYNHEVKKRRKVLSRPYIEDSDSDSSDSEQLIIAKSDDESQMNLISIKSENKNSLCDISLEQDMTTDESQSQEINRNFKFDDLKDESETETVKKETVKVETETVKEEEHDPHLHNLLLCEETIPRSPAPSTECSNVSENKTKSKSVLEMPFASAPGSSNNKNILMSNANEKQINKSGTSQLMLSLENTSRQPSTSSIAIDNTPPTSPATPESTICLSPQGDNGRMSPSVADNESVKSNDGELEYGRQRRNSNKLSSLYSEEDSQMTCESSPGKKQKDEDMPGITRKRRKSSKCDDTLPLKRGRKPLNRSRHNSDSDDTSEDHSVAGSASASTSSYRRSNQTPRPTKYNFYVEFDASVDRTERIAIIMQKLSEVRKTYADVKSELAAVERRRKKLRRREREARRKKDCDKSDNKNDEIDRNDESSGADL